MSGDPSLPAPSQRVPWRRSLYARAMLFTVLGCAALLGALAVQSSSLVEDSVQQLLHERTRLALATGGYLELLIRRDLDKLARVVPAPPPPLGSDHAQGVAVALQAASAGTLFTEGAFVLSRQGAVLVSVPEPPGFLHDRPELKRLVQEARRAGGPVVSRVMALPPVLAGRQGGPRAGVLVLTPIREPDGAIAGYVGGLIDPATNDLLPALETLQQGSSTILEVLDAGGTVIASTAPGGLFRASDHGSVLQRAIAERQPIRSRCHHCHDGGQPEARAVEILAFAPLAGLDLGVAVRQPEREALAPAFALRRRMFWLGLTFLPLFLGFAGLAVHSVVRPLQRLTRAVRNAESQERRIELPVFARDEVGELASALDRWRTRLIESLAAAERHRAQQLRHEQRREFLLRVLQAQEEERQRIARELHDTVAQDLAALRLALERLARQPGELAGRLADLEGNAEEMLATVRRLLVDLRPSVLDTMGFLPALEWYLERVGRDHAIRGRLQIEGDERPLDGELSVALFRVFQECLNNVVQHSKAEHALVTVAFGTRTVELVVEDDGVGFDLSAVTRPGKPVEERGLGLMGMRERARLLGGDVAIDTRSGQGTTVRVTVPVPVAETAAVLEAS